MGKALLVVLLGVLPLLSQTSSPAAIEVPEGIEVQANIAYDQYPETVLDIYQPGGGALAKRPGVIVIHGGGWVNGTKAGMVKNHCVPYLEKGFVVCNVEYRLAKAATAPAAVSDVLKAAKWFRENAPRYGVDRRRIVVTGSSAGGHLALMVGLTPKSAKLGPDVNVAAVVNWCGITDVASQLAGPHERKYAVTWLPPQEGRLDLARQVSPMTWVRREAPAILTIHGDADETVPYEHGVNLTRELREAGADAELISVAGGGHGRFGDERMKELYADIFRFLEKREIIR